MACPLVETEKEVGECKREIVEGKRKKRSRMSVVEDDGVWMAG